MHCIGLLFWGNWMVRISPARGGVHAWELQAQSPHQGGQHLTPRWRPLTRPPSQPAPRLLPHPPHPDPWEQELPHLRHAPQVSALAHRRGGRPPQVRSSSVRPVRHPPPRQPRPPGWSPHGCAWLPGPCLRPGVARGRWRKPEVAPWPDPCWQACLVTLWEFDGVT